MNSPTALPQLKLAGDNKSEKFYLPVRPSSLASDMSHACFNELKARWPAKPLGGVSFVSGIARGVTGVVSGAGEIAARFRLALGLKHKSDKA